jgi:hypothetical protein
MKNAVEVMKYFCCSKGDQNEVLVLIEENRRLAMMKVRQNSMVKVGLFRSEIEAKSVFF